MCCLRKVRDKVRNTRVKIELVEIKQRFRESVTTLPMENERLAELGYKLQMRCRTKEDTGTKPNKGWFGCSRFNLQNILLYFINTGQDSEPAKDVPLKRPQ